MGFRLHAIVVLASVVAYLATPALHTSAAGPCGPPVTSVIACENTLPGDPQTDWMLQGSGDPTIQGFATEISVNAGGTVYFKIKSSAASYHFDILRLGYYQGNGARKVASGLRPTATLPQSQPSCLYDASTGLTDCGNWAVSGSWTVPTSAVSGIYLAFLTRDDTGGESHIPFVVRNDASHSDILFQTQDTTWQAYNSYGGNSFYVGNPAGRAYKLSYNRPFNTADDGQNWLIQNEYPMVRYVEANGYDVSYATGVDIDRRGSLISNHKIFLSVGHDEYWSGSQRTNVQAARDAGVNLAFFSGNEVYWKTRWEGSIDGSGTAYRTLVCYKETWANAVIDPADPPTWTGTWRDPRFSPPADGGRPENQLTGTLTTVISDTSGIQVPAPDGKMRLWRNTSVANLATGQTATVGSTDLGYEWDEALDNGFRPPGLFYMSTTTRAVQNKLDAFGGIQTFPGTATHHLTLYRAASGALVFGAGTIQFAQGLDGGSADRSLMQAVVNLFADMGVQPATLQAGLVPASRSTDATPPTSSITAPSAGASLVSGSTVTITGTAADTGGGVVGGVEVSTDGGSSWHPAGGRESWSYSWTASGLGTVTIKSRAVDDSGNLETPGPGVSVQVNCPCGLFGLNATPSLPVASDANPVELGVAFYPDRDGYVTGVRFYKGAGNTGTHVGNLWTGSGTRLATGTFTNETTSGWQTLAFASPIQVSALNFYVASYFAPAGHYANDSQYFAGAGVDSTPLHVPRASASSPNGLFAYSGTSTFPGNSNSTINANYWVDVVFTSNLPPDNTPPSIASTSPVTGATAVGVVAPVSATFNKAMSASTISFTLTDSNNNRVPGSVSYSTSSQTASFNPSGQLGFSTTYRATVSGQSLTGVAMTSPYTWSFTTTTAPTCPCTIFGSSATPGNAAVSDTGSVELGVKFQVYASGYATGVRFFKGPGNTGTHVGNLWSSSGALLASATFSSETGSGWQQVAFSSPVILSPGTVYVASYFAPGGHYAYDPGYFTQAVTNFPLQARQSTGASPNAVYAYSSTSTFPNTGAGGANYWVDVVYELAGGGATPPTVTAQSPPAGATGVSVFNSVTATFSRAVLPGSIAFNLAGPSGNVAGSQYYNSTNRTVTFTPNSPLTFNASYTATVSGATDPSGNVMATPFTWSFTTGTVSCPCSVWSSATTPAAAATSDVNSVELGVKFRADIGGYVTGIRFYKGAGNTGAHIGNLWTSSGQLLASAKFSGESASGWQTVSFASPVLISANTVYVGSYFAPNGHYAYDSSYFVGGGTDNPPLHALQAGVSGPNGVFAYSGTTIFPSGDGNGGNYWVDVVFEPSPDASAPTVVTQSPAPNSTNVAAGASISVGFSKAVQPGTVSLTVKDPSSNMVAGNLSYDPNTRTATLVPSAPLALSTTYTATVGGAKDLAGNPMSAPASWSFTTAAPSCPCSIWSGTTTPTNAAASDSGAVELGVKFRSDVNGYITGIRFYKGTGNTGTHVGNLWSSGGTRLATASFTGEAASGWQQVTFASPVSVTAGTTYVASYFAPNGHYAFDGGYFSSSGKDTPPLHALANTVSADGVYTYAGSSSFPSSSGNGTNYWVDVIFTT